MQTPHSRAPRTAVCARRGGCSGSCIYCRQPNRTNQPDLALARFIFISPRVFRHIFRARTAAHIDRSCLLPLGAMAPVLSDVGKPRPAPSELRAGGEARDIKPPQPLGLIICRRPTLRTPPPPASNARLPPVHTAVPSHSLAPATSPYRSRLAVAYLPQNLTARSMPVETTEVASGEKQTPVASFEWPLRVASGVQALITPTVMSLPAAAQK